MRNPNHFFIPGGLAALFPAHPLTLLLIGGRRSFMHIPIFKEHNQDDR